MPQQIMRPDADTTIGNFTDQSGGAVNIYQAIDEVLPNDADYIRSPTSPTNEVYVCRLSNMASAPSVGYIMRMKSFCDKDGEEVLDFTMQLREGYVNEGAPGTLISTLTRAGVDSTVPTMTTRRLPFVEEGAIVDPDNLFFRIIVNKP